MMNARWGEQEAYRISHKSNEESGKNISWFWFNCRHFYDQFALNVDKNFLSFIKYTQIVNKEGERINSKSSFFFNIASSSYY